MNGYDRPHDKWQPGEGGSDRPGSGPRRSLRAIRGQWLIGTALFTLGAMAMLLGAGSRNELIVPGPLTSHHAQVIARADWSNRCAACHPGANDSAADWLAAAASGEHATTQSQLCLDCHRDLAGPGNEPLLAHGLPAGTLDKRTKNTPAAASLPSVNPLGAPAHGSSASDALACAACHQEHHGAEHDLAALTDARCQACHTEQFTSFAGDHPDFGLWPTTRRTRIAFNHATHSGQHFAKANQAFDCRSCHQEDATGDLTARPTYKMACASCHDSDITSSFGEGLAVLALPTIDREAIRAAGGSVDAWPRQGEGEFDGELPAITKLLLAADERAADSMRRLGEDFSFFDIDNDASAREAATLVSALTRLLDDLQEEGHCAIGRRLRELLGENAACDADYVARLPVELIDRIQATWLGGAEPPEAFDAIEDRRTGGGWSVDDDRLTLRYRPTGHDDPLMRAWLDAIVSLPPERAALRDACLAEFARPGASGGCLDCHTVDATPGGGLAINWNGRDRLSEPRGFTRFSHRPHLVQPELASCTHCHAIDPAAKSTAAAGADPRVFTSEFLPLSKASCVSCHQPKGAGDSCTQCHNYHVESGQWAVGGEQ